MTHLTPFLRACVALLAWFLPCSAPLPAQVQPDPTATARSAEGDRLSRSGDLEGAVREYSAALTVESGLRSALLGRAQAREWLGLPEAALRDLDRLLRDAPNDVDGLAARGRVHVRLGRHARGAADLERAVSLRGDDAELLTWYGLALLELGENERAFEVLQLANSLAPTSDFTLDMLATVELELGRLDSSLRHADAAIRIEPRHAEYHFTRSRILRALGRRAEADEAAATATRLDPAYADLDGTDPDSALRGLLGLLCLVVGLLTVMSLIGLALARGARAALQRVPEGELPARYDGRAADLFRIYLQNVVLTVLTLGIYRFWAKVRIRRYRYQHTAFAGGRFDYHATGREKFVGFLKGMVLLAPLLGGAWVLNRQLVPSLGEDRAFTVSFGSFMLAMFLLRPLILVGSQRYNLGRTSWNNLRLRFTGRIGAAYRLYALDLLLMVVTFGIAFAWHQVRVREFRLRHSELGDRKFGFRGTGEQLFGILFFGTLLCYLTMGFYVPWQIARLHRFHTENTTFHGHRLRSRLTGGQVMSMGAPAVLISVLTLGLAIPWMLDRWYRLITDTTSYEGPIDADELRSIHDAKSSALLEGLGESGDALSEVGDLFGA